MATVSKEDIIETLKAMTLLEASELSKELKEIFGVSAAVARCRRSCLWWW